MAAAAHFEPTVDTFGQLTLGPTKRRESVIAPMTEAQIRSRNHFFIGLGFVTVLLTGLSALYVADRAFYPAGYESPIVVAPLPVDYN